MLITLYLQTADQRSRLMCWVEELKIMKRDTILLFSVLTLSARLKLLSSSPNFGTFAVVSCITCANLYLFPVILCTFVYKKQLQGPKVWKTTIIFNKIEEGTFSWLLHARWTFSVYQLEQSIITEYSNYLHFSQLLWPRAHSGQKVRNWYRYSAHF